MWPTLTIDVPPNFDTQEIQRKLNVLAAIYGKDKVIANVVTKHSNEPIAYKITVKDENVTQDQLQKAYEEA